MKYQVCRPLTPIEYEALKSDIAENGVLVPVEVDENGDTLDGHHRIKAWQELKDEGLNLTDYPRMIRAGMTEEQKRNHARKLNVLRRQMTKEEREEMMVDMRKDGMSYRKIAEAVSVDPVTVLNVIKKSGVEISTPVTGADGKQYPATQEKKQPVPQTALFVTNEKQQSNYIDVLQKAKEQAPDIYEDIATGKKKVTEAQRELRHREIENAPPLPTSKYRVLYVDPPWSYNNSGAITDNDNYGRAERHYPTMSIDELCTMGDSVKTMMDSNSVMFMWVTSPLLEESFAVINAWGFKYKSSFVWDKVSHNFAHYNSMRHEFLLVCTRGSCTPDASELLDSVVSIEKSRNHSEKPEEFRRIIEKLYTNGRRIELFARKQNDGWDTWGNETDKLNA
jgi:N6-adenosine-specific RNA methylase IME4/ParB-like chromosome segregation protein Spo0J